MRWQLVCNIWADGRVIINLVVWPGLILSYWVMSFWAISVYNNTHISLPYKTWYEVDFLRIFIWSNIPHLWILQYIYFWTGFSFYQNRGILYKWISSLVEKFAYNIFDHWCNSLVAFWYPSGLCVSIYRGSIPCFRYCKHVFYADQTFWIDTQIRCFCNEGAHLAVQIITILYINRGYKNQLANCLIRLNAIH